MTEPAIVYREIIDPKDPHLKEARALYEGTQAAEERIPWKWIVQGVEEGASWKPGQWRGHLLVAEHPGRNPGVIGFAWGSHIPGYGGYLGYLGVDPQQRGRRVGGGLIGLMAELVQADSAVEGEPTPFLIWESHRPDAWASPDEQANWLARLRLFERVGARWLAGLDFHAPAFGRRDRDSVVMQLFLLPLAVKPESLGPEQLRAAAAGLFSRVYGRSKKDPLVRVSLPAEVRPRLESPLLAGSRGS